ncbi:MAG: GPR endopeptidase [Clostridia bacterium]|nr:GPR endopeptidase [Clostridia bacterium]
MNLRTDLALEQREISAPEETDGIECEEVKKGEAKITRIEITNENGEKKLNRKRGTYITVELPNLSRFADFSQSAKTIADELIPLLPQEGLILVAGLGNDQITPDALGPGCASLIFSTRHIGKELQKSIGFEHLRPVARVIPGVLGQNGLETVEILEGIIRRVSPAALITVDALASRRLSRLGCTVQICNTGISPGSGVGNARAEISPETVGVPVISIGVPTVVDAVTLACDLIGEAAGERMEKDGEKMMVTPREIDLLIEHASKLVAASINSALQPHMDIEELMALVS